jgi:outer membrane lipoprotein-sorting protein
MRKTIGLLLAYIFISLSLFSQNPANYAQAAALLQKVGDKYKSYKNNSSQFKLIIVKPKPKPEDDDRKYTDTLSGTISIQGSKFRIEMGGQQIICDGKNIWTYIIADKEVQVNYYEESEDIFSPSKIFSLYREGYMYQIKEKKNIAGKPATVIEMAPVNKKVSYYKIDVSIDDETSQIIDSKVYEKNGVRYIYKLFKQQHDTPISDSEFTFDVKKFPGVKVVDLR